MSGLHEQSSCQDSSSVNCMTYVQPRCSSHRIRVWKWMPNKWMKMNDERKVLAVYVKSSAHSKFFFCSSHRGSVFFSRLFNLIVIRLKWRITGVSICVCKTDSGLLSSSSWWWCIYYHFPPLLYTCLKRWPPHASLSPPQAAGRILQRSCIGFFRGRVLPSAEAEMWERR